MKTYNGNVAIIVVVTFLAISMIAGISLSFSAINYQLATIGFVTKTTMKQLEYTCQEEALRKIANIPSYTGLTELDLDNGRCSYQISINSENPSIRNVNLYVNFNEYTQNTSVSVDTTTSPISILKTD